MVQQHSLGRDYEFREPTLRREPTVRSGDFSRELQGETGESQPTESTDDAETRAKFWSIRGDFINRHHNDTPSSTPRAGGNTFRMSLTLLQEKRFDDYWNVDSNRHLSDS